MEELKQKIKEFLRYSNDEPKNYDFGAIGAKMKKQDEMLAEIEALAKANNTLLGRNIQFPHADSYAQYIIVSVRPRTVVLSWFDYCDGWVDDRVGYVGTVSLKFAQQHVAGRDHMAEIFAKRQINYPTN